MAPDAEGVEHLLCATCQQPAKLQCPRWCAPGLLQGRWFDGSGRR